MKSLRSFILWSCAAILLVLSSDSLRAQNDTLRIAYVNSGRTEILGFQTGKTKPDTILKSNATITLSHVAALAASPDGQFLLIGARAHFTNNQNNTKDSIQGFFRITLPFKLTGFPVNDRLDIQGMKVLQEIPFDQSNFLKPLPIGILTDDGQQWYGTWAKTGAAVLTFYHGNFNGTGTVDQASITDSRAMIGGYHMTNLICTPAGNQMIAVTMDRLNTQTGHQERCQLIRWTQGTTGIQITDIGDNVYALRGNKNWNIDSAFSCVLRRIDGTYAELALSPGKDAGNINFYNFVYGGGVVGFGSPSRMIPRSVLNDSIIFFCGWDGTNMANEQDDRETTIDMQRANNAGDMVYTPSGDSVIFIVHESAFAKINPAKTGIWVHQIGSSKAQLLYNDATKIERQPVFITYKNYVAPPPPKPGSIAFTPTDVNMIDSIEVGKDTTITVKITETTGRDVKINSVIPGGPNVADFTITASDIIPPATLAKNAVANFTIKFAPKAIGHRTAFLTVKFADSPDSSRTLNLAGNAKAKPTGGSVGDVGAPSFHVSISPNPFGSKTHITVTGDENSQFMVSMTDVLGKEIKIAPLPYQYLRGGTADYEIDAQSLGLAPGSYLLHVRSGEDVVTRQIVFVK